MQEITDNHRKSFGLIEEWEMAGIFDGLECGVRESVRVHAADCLGLEICRAVYDEDWRIDLAQRAAVVVLQSHADVRRRCYPPTWIPLVLRDLEPGRRLVILAQATIHFDQFALIPGEQLAKIEVVLHERVELALCSLWKPLLDRCKQVITILGHDQHAGRRDENQCLDVFGELSSVEGSQKSPEGVSDQNQLVVAQYAADPFDIGQLRAEAQRPVQSESILIEIA